MKRMNKIVMVLAGLFLILAAVLKAHQILTSYVPGVSEIAEKYAGFEFLMRVLDSREVMVWHVPLEIGLGVWLMSGLFRKAGWLLGVLTFLMFLGVTGYKGVNGYGDCGCFGLVKLNPWVTFGAVDVPVLLLLLIFRPKGEKLFGRCGKVHFWSVFAVAIIAIAPVTGYLLASEPVLPEELPEAGVRWEKLENIDVADQIDEGMWVVLLYHNDCSNCQEAIPMYEAVAPDYAGNISFAFVEIPPYGDMEDSIIPEDTNALVGRLDESEDWIIQTPRVLLLVDGVVMKAWEVDAPSVDEILNSDF